MNSPPGPCPSPRRPRLPWALPVAANLLLGVVAIVPLWFLMSFARNHPLAALGLTSREPTDNDGMLPWAMLLVPMWAVVLGLWIPPNVLMRGRTGASRGRYWACASLVALAPTGVLVGVLGV